MGSNRGLKIFFEGKVQKSKKNPYVLIINPDPVASFESEIKSALQLEGEQFTNLRVQDVSQM